MKMLHRVQKMLLGQLNWYTVRACSTIEKNGITKSWFHSVVSYCRDVSEVKPMSGICHCRKMLRPFEKEFISLIPIQGLGIAKMKMVTESKEGQNCVKDRVPSHESLYYLVNPVDKVAVQDQIKIELKRLSLAPWEPFPDKGMIFWRRGRLKSILNFYFWNTTTIPLCDLKDVEKISITFLDYSIEAYDKSWFRGCTRPVH